MNAENNVTIPSSKWTTISKLPVDGAVPSESTGCVAIHMSWNANARTAIGALKKVQCASNPQPVTSYMCERKDPNFPCKLVRENTT